MLHTDGQRLIEIFLKVLSINALSGYEKPIANYITSFLSESGYRTEKDASRRYTLSDTGNLICKIGTGGDFLIMSHMDTARPTLETKPIIKEDRIVSSGDTVLGVDNRAGVAVLLYMLEKIAKEKIQVKNFTVAFTTCEETTLFGSKYLEIDEAIKKGFIFDSGYRPGNFITSACGAMGFKMKIIGKASHSGIAPERGINSMQAAAKAITKLPLGRIDEETTMNIGILKSGTAVNVVPQFTELEGEVRSFNVAKAEHYFNLLKTIFTDEAENMMARIELESFWDFVPYTVPSDSDVYKEVVSAISKAGLTPTPKISLGGSDANSLNARGIQSINLGIGAQNPHSNDEFIFIEDLIKSADIALALVKKEL